MLLTVQFKVVESALLQFPVGGLFNVTVGGYSTNTVKLDDENSDSTKFSVPPDIFLTCLAMQENGIADPSG